MAGAFFLLALAGIIYDLFRHAQRNVSQPGVLNASVKEQIGEREKARKAPCESKLTLGARVRERTATIERHAQDFQRGKAEFESFMKAPVGRGKRMIELKEKIDEILEAAGNPRAYDLSFLGGDAP